MEVAEPVDRRFRVALAALCLVALLLRAWAPQRFGIDHYDEGVYAFSASAVAAPGDGLGLYPEQEKFSPPLYFGAGGLLARASGARVDQVLVWLNAVLGAATVGLLGLVGRRWFGGCAGLAAGTLLALSEFHVALSRSALTDVAFALAHLGAVFALVRAVSSARLLDALAAGACVAVAWNLKYHGWLAVVSVALGSVPLLVARWRASEDWRRPLLAGVVASLVALVGYAPWAAFIESQPGGYAGLAAYQSTMLRGAYLENIGRHLQQQRFLDGPLGAASLPLAAGAAWWLGVRAPKPGHALVVLSALVGLALLAGAGAGGFVLAALAAPALVRRARKLELGALALLAWLVVWAVLTPLYQPYARLLLPLSIAAALAAGAGLHALGSALASVDQRGQPPWRRASALAVACASCVALVAWLRGGASDPWRSARGMERTANELARHVPAGARVFVIGEPGLSWYLVRAGLDAAEVVSGPECLERLERDARETFVACGIYPQRTGAEARLVAGAGERLERVASVPLEVKDLRLLDDFPPYAAARFRRSPGDDYQVRLHRYRPGGAAR